MGLASMPTVRVYIGFNSTPLTPYASITWTNVQDYVTNIELTRGRVDETRPFESGTVTIRLLNNDRRFDPTNTSGPYYGQLLPRRPVRIEAQYEDQVFFVFRGWTSGFPVEYSNAGVECYTTIQCFDALGLLASTRFADNFYRREYLSFSPTVFYPMDDRDNSYTIVDAVEPRVNLSTDPTPAGDGDAKTASPSIIPAVTTSSVSNLSDDGIQALSYSTFPFSAKNTTADKFECVAFWVLSLWKTGDTPQAIRLMHLDASPLKRSTDIQVKNRIFVYDYNYSSLGPVLVETLVSKSSVKINDGKPHFIVIKYNNGIPRIFVDGVESWTYGSSTTYDQFYDTQYMILDFQATAITTLQYLAFFPDLTSETIKYLYDAGILYLRETSIARFERIVNELAIDQIQATWDTIGNENEVGFFNLSGENALNALQTLALSDNGEVYALPTGELQFYGRDGVLGTKTTSTPVTFNQTGSANVKYRGDLALDYSAEQVRNLVIVEDSFGNQVQAVDPTSYNTYGESAEILNTITADSNVAGSVAVRRVQLFKDAKTTVTELVIDPQTQTTQWGKMLGLDLLDQVSFTIAPPSGSSLTIKMLVQQIRYEITPARWVIGILGSQRMTGYFITNSSLTDGTDVVL